MSKRLDITGHTYGRLTAIKVNDDVNLKTIHWMCQCSCGKTVSVYLGRLRSGATKSCGCLQKEGASARKTTHGQTKRGEKWGPSYISWRSMIIRCTIPSHHAYPRYGGRGITICKEWIHSFENFLRDLGERPEGMTLDRIDVNKGYYKENCRWATKLEQSSNKSTNRFITYNNKTLTLTQWANELGINKHTLWRRLDVYKWPLDKALNPKAIIKRARDENGQYITIPREFE